MDIEHQLNPQDESRARIRIEGLRQDLRILHLTDSHMVEGDDRDPEAADEVKSAGARFATRTPDNVPPRDVFAATLDQGKQEGLDAAVMTGDIIHFPAYRGLEIINEGLTDLDVPYLYTLGNHDWHFPYLPWTKETRQAHYPRFHGLTGDDPACQSLVIGGVRLIAIDNSNYQVSNRQVEFLRQELAHGEPSLLFIHIPLAIESLTDPVMDVWKAPIMMAAEQGWTEQTRELWKVPGNEEATLAMQELLVTGDSANLAGIFCGHVHFAHVDAYREGRYQYVTAPGFGGGSRVIELTAG